MPIELKTDQAQNSTATASQIPAISLGTLSTDLRFLDITEVFTELTGLTASEYRGQRLDQLVPTIDKNVLHALKRLIAGRQQVVAVDLPRSRRSSVSAAPAGPDVPVWRISFYPKRDFTGSVVAISTVATNISELQNRHPQCPSLQSLPEFLISQFQRLTTLPASQVDHQITDSLRRLAAFLGVDYAGLALLDRTGKFTLTHHYRAGSIPPIHSLDLNDSFPWAAAALRKGEVVRLRNPLDLPPEATNERSASITSDLKSCLAVPFSIRSMPLCAMTLACTNENHWPDHLIPDLQFAGSMLAQAIAHKQMEVELQHTRESLAHMLRVTMTGQLATSIAHEINQPLSAMLANAQAAMRFLSRAEPDFAETTEALTEIVRDGKRAGEVIARAHTMLKRHDVEYSSQDINSLIAAIRPVIDNYATLRHIRVSFNLDTSLPPVRGHGVQLQQVALNLLINAIDAIPAERASDGIVSLSTALCPIPDQVIIRVHDNGVGLPSGPVEQIFRPFFTSKPSGLGMGLNISRTIVEAHGGQLWAERNPDAGATFRFTIPVY